MDKETSGNGERKRQIFWTRYLNFTENHYFRLHQKKAKPHFVKGTLYTLMYD